MFTLQRKWAHESGTFGGWWRQVRNPGGISIGYSILYSWKKYKINIFVMRNALLSAALRSTSSFFGVPKLLRSNPISKGDFNEADPPVGILTRRRKKGGNLRKQQPRFWPLPWEVPLGMTKYQRDNLLSRKSACGNKCWSLDWNQGLTFTVSANRNARRRLL